MPELSSTPQTSSPDAFPVDPAMEERRLLEARMLVFYDPIFSRVMSGEPEVAQQFIARREAYAKNGVVNPETFSEEYQKGVAIPAQRLWRGINVMYDFRSPPREYTGYLDFEGVKDIIASDIDRADIDYRLIRSALEQLTVTPEELQNLKAYASAMRKAEDIEREIRSLQQDAASERRIGIKVIENAKRKRYVQP